MQPSTFVPSLARLHLYLSPKEQMQCLRAAHTRAAICTALDTMNNAREHEIMRYAVSPLSMTTQALTLPFEPLAIAVDGVGALAAKSIGYTLALGPACIGALAGCLSPYPHHQAHVGEHFLATLLLFEKSARIPLQAIPVTLCLHGVELASAVMCGAAKLIVDALQRQMML